MGRYKDYHREPKRGGFESEKGSGTTTSESRSDNVVGSSPPRRTAAPSHVTGQVTESIGTVSVYKVDKGFGFVKQDSGGNDVFVHATALARAGLSGLEMGQRVRMFIGQGQKGLEAKTIELLD